MRAGLRATLTARPDHLGGALGISAYKSVIGDVPIHTYFDRASFVQSYQAAVRDAVGS